MIRDLKNFFIIFKPIQVTHSSELELLIFYYKNLHISIQSMNLVGLKFIMNSQDKQFSICH